jgi:hypothetical protein
MSIAGRALWPAASISGERFPGASLIAPYAATRSSPPNYAGLLRYAPARAAAPCGHAAILEAAPWPTIPAMIRDWFNVQREG